MGFLQTVLARILAAWIAGIVSWLAVKYGVSISPEDQANLVQHMLGIALPIFMTIYAVVHKLLNKKLNPGDAASTHLAEREANETAQLKAADRARGL